MVPGNPLRALLAGSFTTEEEREVLARGCNAKPVGALLGTLKSMGLMTEQLL